MKEEEINLELLEEIRMIGQMSVQMHQTLDELYHWAESLKNTYPKNKQMLPCANFVKEKCLECGLFEIYGEA